MRNFGIVFCLLVAALTPVSASAELKWSFDALPPNALCGDASIQSIGPTSIHFRGLPEHNNALRLDGRGDYVRVADQGADSELDFSAGDPISMEAWVRLDRIGAGQNVYIIGKGRTHLGGPKDNQNYALRLRGIGGEARVSFLFRSQADDQHPSDWHRWTSKQGFRVDGTWHHVAVSYRFGDPKSMRGYVDGKQVAGAWDMGGPTARAPIVDDDELWIGSSLGGNPGNSLAGAVDEVMIHRELVPARQFVNRRVVIVRPPQPPVSGLQPGTVSISLYENVGSETVWPVQLPTPLIEYQQTAFVVPRIPAAYASGGVRRDWSGPVLISAMADVEVPAGETQWMLRAGGLSRLWIDDQIVAHTPAHLKSSSGHGKVTRYHQEDPWLRPPRAGHREQITTHRLEQSQPGPVRITLQSIIGGKDLRYEAGEILVAYRTESQAQWQVLDLTRAVPLTDQDWNGLAARIEQQVQRVDDRQRRLAASAEDEYWQRRHRHAKRWVESLPPIELPPAAETPSEMGIIDRLINARIESGKQQHRRSKMTTDRQLIRRLYLDCLGVIPTVAEIESFEARTGDRASRRQALIEHVLADPRWADHWTSYWMDALAENPNVLKPSLNNSGPFRWYLYDVLRDNVAVDRWVSGLVSMRGSAAVGGPAGFAIAAQNDVPMAAKAHILCSAFLAINMKCARCHDAPYHDWTQRDLFSIAAMLDRKPVKVPATSSVPKTFFAEGEQSLITLSVEPGEAISAQWPLSDYTTTVPLQESLLDPAQDSRARFALYLTRAENQQFAKTVVNRLWKRLLGEGIVEPVEDWEGAKASHPLLLEFLARELTANQYDLKHVARLILNSNAYQRQAADRPIQRNAKVRLFASPRLRRMTAEQLVDSMHVAVGRPMHSDELTFDPEARMKPAAHSNLGRPRRA
ncbi:MAG: DUF1553 domain-containing protein, partial [Pirellulales bacterium]|nr:DUF1553 domain-containing protein [Pirellulales bacterium]